MILILENTNKKIDCHATLKLLMIEYMYKQSKLQTIQSATDYAVVKFKCCFSKVK